MSSPALPVTMTCLRVTADEAPVAYGGAVELVPAIAAVWRPLSRLSTTSDHDRRVALCVKIDTINATMKPTITATIADRTATPTGVVTAPMICMA